MLMYLKMWHSVFLVYSITACLEVEPVSCNVSIRANTCTVTDSDFQGASWLGARGLKPPATDDNPPFSCNFWPPGGWHSPFAADDNPPIHVISGPQGVGTAPLLPDWGTSAVVFPKRRSSLVLRGVQKNRWEVLMGAYSAPQSPRWWAVG